MAENKSEAPKQLVELIDALAATVAAATSHNTSDMDDASSRFASAASALFERSKGRGIVMHLAAGVVHIAGVAVRDESAPTASRVREAMSAQHVSILQISSAPTPEGARALGLSLVGLGDDAQTEAMNEGGFKLFQTPTAHEPRRRALASEPGWQAARAYTESLLAYREQKARLTRGASGPVRFRAARALQDLYEAILVRPDIVGRIATTHEGAEPDELVAANTAAVSMLLGRFAGLPDAVVHDLGLAGLFHAVAQGDRPSRERAGTDLSFAAIVGESHVFGSGYRRAIVVSERRLGPEEELAWGKPRPAANVLGRIVRVASTFAGLLVGLDRDDGSRMTTIEAIEALYKRPNQFDPGFVDLLMNVFRAFPIGVEVMLEDGTRAVVQKHVEDERWDAPDILIDGFRPLSLRSASTRIAWTSRHAGTEPTLEGRAQQLMARQAGEAPPPPRGGPRRDQGDSLDLGMGEDDDAPLQLAPVSRGASSRSAPAAPARAPQPAQRAAAGPREVELALDDDAPLELEIERTGYSEESLEETEPEPPRRAAEPQKRAPEAPKRAPAPPRPEPPKPETSDDDDMIDLGI